MWIKLGLLGRQAVAGIATSVLLFGTNPVGARPEPVLERAIGSKGTATKPLEFSLALPRSFGNTEGLTMRVPSFAATLLQEMMSPSRPSTPARTLLDQVGRLAEDVPSAQVAQWRSELASISTNSERKQWIRLWLGEVELGRKEPDRATAIFERLLQDATGPVKGIARLDLAFARFRSGRFKQCIKELKDLVASEDSGYEPIYAAALLRHAQACAGYHQARADAGITEPPHLDPLCGAAAVAVALRRYGRPYDEASIASKVPHNGEGSSFKDVITGCKALGLTGIHINAGPEALRALYMSDPSLVMVAFVEHDHFVALINADKHGVSYTCSDCGDWPGGNRTLTWDQWALMDCTQFVAMPRPGSILEEVLPKLPRAEAKVQQLLAMRTFGFIQPRSTAVSRAIAALRTAGVALPLAPWDPVCGTQLSSQHCVPCRELCPEQLALINKFGPSHGDPVNLATLSEEYKPPADLAVYNPRGPSVTWGHRYTSLAKVVSNGFGMGWSHPYMYFIDCVPSAGGDMYLTYPNTGRVLFTINTGGQIPDANHQYYDAASLPFPIHFRWQYNAQLAVDEFVVRHEDLSKWFFRKISAPPPGARTIYALSEIQDVNGKAIKLNWSNRNFHTWNPYYRDWNLSFPGLTSITDADGSALLTVNYDATNKLVQSVNDRYGRYVYYTYQRIDTTPVTGGQYDTFNDVISQVSMVCNGPTGTPPGRYQYGYTLYDNGVGGNPIERVPYLTTITTPSLTGTGTATATITYGNTAENPGEGYFVRMVTDANGNKIKFTPSQASTQTTVSFHDANNVEVRKYTVEFDGEMNWRKVFDSQGNLVLELSRTNYRPIWIKVHYSQTESKLWHYEWSGGQLTRITTPKGTQTTNDYSSPSQDFPIPLLKGSTSVGGGVTLASTEYTRDSLGRVIEIEGPVPGEASTATTVAATQVSAAYSYDTLGNITSVTTAGNGVASNKVWSLNYTDDGSYHQSEPYVGQPLAVTDPNGKVTHLRYDARGNTISAKDALGNEATATYLFNDQTDSIFMPATGQNGTGAAKTSFTYAFPHGPVITTRAYDESGVLRRTYNSLYGKEGELLEVNGDTETLKYTYDAAYAMATFKDGKNNATTYTYDLNGRPIDVKFPNHTSGTADRIQYTGYDRAGNLLTSIDGRGNVTTLTYDDGDKQLSQLTKGSSTYNYTYDAFGRLTQVTDPTGSSTSSYDDLGTVISSTRTYTGQAAQVFGYKFWPDGSRKRMITPVGDWNYFYDVVGRCSQMTSPAGTVNYTYLDNGDVASREILNTSGSAVSFTSYQYNAAGLLKTLTNKTSSVGTTRSSYDMTPAGSYDPVFNLQSLSASVTGVSSQTGTATFTHDPRERLTNEGGTRGAPMGAIAYDNANNPTTYRGASGLTFNANNQRTGQGWVYDGNGNPNNYNHRIATYDVFDRLASMGTPPVGYTYRADGLIATRAKAVFVFDPEEGEWVEQWQPATYFYHDGGEPVLERQSGAVTAINVRGPDGLVARKQGATWTYYTFDQQGNVSQRLDSAGVVVSSSVYDAYGAETTTGTAPTDACGYNAQWGYWLDRDTGLYLCQARWYDPVTGRWVTRDPIGYAGGANLYGYCGGGPIGWADRSGLQRMDSIRANPVEAAESLLIIYGAEGLVSAGAGAAVAGAGSAVPGASAFAAAARAVAAAAALILPARTSNDDDTDVYPCNDDDDGSGIPLRGHPFIEDPSRQHYSDMIKNADWSLEGIKDSEDCWDWAARMELAIGIGWSTRGYRLLMDDIDAKRAQCLEWVRLNGWRL